MSLESIRVSVSSPAKKEKVTTATLIKAKFLLKRHLLSLSLKAVAVPTYREEI